MVQYTRFAVVLLIRTYLRFRTAISDLTPTISLLMSSLDCVNDFLPANSMSCNKSILLSNFLTAWGSVGGEDVTFSFKQSMTWTSFWILLFARIFESEHYAYENDKPVNIVLWYNNNINDNYVNLLTSQSALASEHLCFVRPSALCRLKCLGIWIRLNTKQRVLIVI